MRFAHWAALATLFTITALGSTAGRADDFSLPPPPTHNLEHRNLWATVYFVHIARESLLPWRVPLRGPGMKSTGIRLSKEDWCLGALEGTIRVQTRQGVRTFNHAGFSDKQQTDCSQALHFIATEDRKLIERTLFLEVPDNAPDGLGSNADYKLVPYRSIATDITVIPTGTVLYIPSLKNAAVPGGHSHDGFVMAVDTGVGIRDTHVDFFIGMKANPVPAPFDANPKNPFTAYIVQDPTIGGYLKNLHRRR